MWNVFGRLGVVVGLVVFMLGLAGGVAQATDATKVVIQVSTDDKRTQMIALNNAVNVQKALPDAEVEIVAYGPGLGMLTGASAQKDRISSLAMSEGITFSACGNTMNNVAKKSGNMPVLIDGVKVVPAGVVRIMELQSKGYAYIRP